MKKSQRITLTVVAAMGLAAANAQTPAAQPDPNDCKTARASGTPIPGNCEAKAGHGGGHQGGFGATAKGNTGGS
jgi:hypothetical protein